MRSVVVATVVVLLLAGGGAVAVDRVAHARTQTAAEDGVAHALTGVVGTPRVDIQGFPFLTQVWAGRLDRVTGSVAGASLDGLAVRDIQLDAHGVRLRGTRTVDDLTLSATVPTSTIRTELAARTGLTNLQLEVRNGSLVLGLDRLGVPVQVTGTPAVAGGNLTVQVASITVGAATLAVDDLPPAVAAMVSRLVVPVTGLPAGLVLTHAAVVPAGVRLTAAGHDVPVPSTLP